VAFANSFSQKNQAFLPFLTSKKCSFLQVFEEFSFCISSPWEPLDTRMPEL
jgi:hypothetical protein